MFDVGQWIEEQYLVLERTRHKCWIHYKVQDRISEKIFIIKRPLEILLLDKSIPARIAAEAKIWIGIGECEEIVYAYMLKEFDGVPHLFLEYTEGPSLADILNLHPGKCLPLGQTVALMKQLVSGMKFLHNASLGDEAHGVIHGGLNPRNILTRSGNIKIADVGLSYAVRQSHKYPNIDYLLEEIAYLAPEQAADPSKANKLADIYSFGAILYEVATGAPPKIAGKTGEFLDDIVRLEPVPPRLRNRSCPVWLEEAILKCMAREAGNRFQSFEQIEKFLNRVLEGEKISDSRDESPGAGKAPASRVARVRGVGKKESRRLGHFYLGVEHLMLGLIKEEESLVVSSLGDRLTAEQLRQELLARLPKGEGPWYWEGIKKTPRYNRVMNRARKIRKEYGHGRMLPQHMLLAILEEGRNVPTRALRELKVDVKAAAKNLRCDLKRKSPAIPVADLDTPLGRFTEKVLCTLYTPDSHPFVGRRHELEKAADLLIEDRKSIFVVGEPGVGKTAFVRELECLLSEKSANSHLECGGVFELKTPALLASSQERDQVISNLLDVINGIIGTNSILCIDEVHATLGMGVKMLSGEFAKIFEEYSGPQGLAMIAVTTPAGYAACQLENQDLLAYSEVIRLDGPSSVETAEILAGIRENLESEHSLNITDDALGAALDLSRNIRGRALPGSAIDILEQACIMARVAETAGAAITIDPDKVACVRTEGSRMVKS